MNKFFYPAIFHKAEEGGFWISFPDFPECLSQGENLSEAYSMACDALGLCISDYDNDNKPLPTASLPENINTQSNEYIVLIQFDYNEYKRKYNNKSIKKTLTIPQWLNEQAISKNVNFSQVLQDALIEKCEYSYDKNTSSYISDSHTHYSTKK